MEGTGADENRTAGGNMIFIEHTTDFEMFSSTSAGAVQGYGYTFHTGRFLDLCLL
jgi:rhamnogalacturonan hydrolase